MSSRDVEIELGDEVSIFVRTAASPGMQPVARGQIGTVALERFRAALDGVAAFASEARAALDRQHLSYEGASMTFALEIRGDGRFQIVEFGATSSLSLEVSWKK